MKTSYKRVISIMLCLLLLSSALGVSAFAEKTEICESEYTDLPYKYYTTIGDSVPWGYGLQEEGLNTGDVSCVGMRVAGAYPDLMGAVLEDNNGATVHFASSSGSRLSDYREMLEAALGYENPYVHQGDAYGDRKAERAEVLFNLGPKLVEWLGESDLITLQVGFNDVTAALVNTACASGLIDINEFQKIEDCSDALCYAVNALNNIDCSPTTMLNIHRQFVSELIGIRTNIEAVIAEVAEAANDNADIIIVGYYNAISVFSLTPDTDSMTFKILNTALLTLNDCYSAAADKYDNVHFVECPDVETFYPKGTTITSVLEDTSGALLGIHPDAEGQRYIAKTVLDSLVMLNNCHHENVKTVEKTVSFGSFETQINMKVCSDCGKVVNYGNLVTPFGTFDIPEQTISYVTKTFVSSLNSLIAKFSK